MPTQTLSSLMPPGRRGTAAALALPGGLTLVRGRVHEACGPARRTFALLAGRGLGGDGPILWIRPAFMAERLNPDGVRPFFDPGRIVFVTPLRAEDLLWSAEEALRSGAAPLVVADLTEAPALTPVRRLHLAAEAGAALARIAPLGLILTPGEGGAQGAETRWHIAPRHGPVGPTGTLAPAQRADAETTGWTLSLRRARAQPPAAWHLAATDGIDAQQHPGFTLARSGAEPGMVSGSCPVMPGEG